MASSDYNDSRDECIRKLRMIADDTINHPYNDYFTDISFINIPDYRDEIDDAGGESSAIDRAEACSHPDIKIHKGAEICSSCGRVIHSSISLDDKDSRYYGVSDNRHSKDATRCHKRKYNQRSIFKDVEGMHFPDSIVEAANQKYQAIIGDDIYRGSKRKSIIVACIYYSYMSQDEYKPIQDLLKKFNLTKKNMKEGFSKYTEKFPQSAIKYVEPIDLIQPIIVKTGINFIHLKKIQKLCNFLDNKSSLLNRSNPQSVAAAIVYVYLCLDEKYKASLQMNRMKFAGLVNLSEITISRLGKEVQKIIGNEDIRL